MGQRRSFSSRTSLPVRGSVVVTGAKGRYGIVGVGFADANVSFFTGLIDDDDVGDAGGAAVRATFVATFRIGSFHGRHHTIRKGTAGSRQRARGFMNNRIACENVALDLVMNVGAHASGLEQSRLH